MIVDGRLLTGVAGLRRRDRPPARSTRTGAPCRCGSIGCWETEVGEGVLLALAGYPADAGRAGIDAVLREAEAGSRAGARAPSPTSAAGWASASAGSSTSSTRG